MVQSTRLFPRSMGRWLMALLLVMVTSLAARAAEAYACRNNDTLTFYYDNQRSSREGSTFSLNTGDQSPEWSFYQSPFTSVVFDPSFAGARPTTTYRWFHKWQGGSIHSITGLNYLNTSEVTNMKEMFSHCTEFTALDLSNFNTAKVTNMQGMFEGCTSLRTIYVGNGWSTDAVTQSSNMFTFCTSLVGGRSTIYNSKKVNKAYAHIDGGPSNPGYFTAAGDEPAPEPYACLNDFTLTLYFDTERSTREGTTFNLNTSDAEPPGWMSSLFNSVVFNSVVFDPSFAEARPTTTYSWFGRWLNEGGLTRITGLNYPNTSEVKNMKEMFYHCTGLTTLDLSSFNTAKVTDMQGMFEGCTSLRTIYVDNGWSTAAVTSSDNMFLDCTSLVGGRSTTFDPDHIDKAYARIDGGASNPGYFTAAGDEPAPEPYACLNNYMLTFYYDNQRSTREGTTYNLNTGSHFPDWMSKLYNIVVFDPSFAGARPTTTYTWFGRLLNEGGLTRINGLNYLNTSEVTNMQEMFYHCTGLTTLDLSSFNTAKVTNMQGMFEGCTSLTTVYAGNGWSTAAVSNSEKMFLDCSSLVGGKGTTYNSAHVNKDYAHIDGGSSNPGYFTSDVNSPYACYTPSNTTLTFYYDDLRNSRDGTTYDLNESNNTPSWYSDSTCVNVTKVVFNTSFVNARPTTTFRWFAHMYKLTSIIGISNLNTANVTSMSSMFKGCTSLASVDLSGLNTVNVTNMDEMFGGCTGLTSVNVSNWNTVNVTNMNYLFHGCSALANLDLSGFNTAKVTAMAEMFSGCSALTSLNVNNFNTANLKTMYCMFRDCTGLRVLNLSSFSTNKVTNMSGVFHSCSNLSTIYVGDGWSTGAVTQSNSMFTGCTSLAGGMGTTYDANHVNATYAHIDGGSSNPGYFTDYNAPMPNIAYACYTPSNKTLTFYYDNQRLSRPGTTYFLNEGTDDPLWYTDSTCRSVTTVLITAPFANVRPTSMFHWFADMSKLTYISGFSFLKTDNVTTMWGMFHNCSKLTSLDVSNFNTANVTNMGSMFNGCSRLTSLYLNNFNTANVTQMNFMFMGCTGLTNLDLSSFNTANVTSMTKMFIGCTGLTSLNQSSFNTANVENMNGMFDGCSGLTTLDLSNFNTEKVRIVYEMFRSCSNLTTIYVGNGWSTNAVTDSWRMFTGCTSLVGGMGTTYNASHVDKTYAHIDGGPSNPGYFTDINAEPEAYACYTPENTTLTFYYDALRSIRTGTTYDLNTGSRSPGWVSDGINASVTKAVFSSTFADVRPTTTYRWFYNMANLTSITGISYLKTNEVTNMQYMFRGCSGLTSLNLSGFNTAKVTDMSYMFYNCTALTSLNVTNWNTANVTTMMDMFSECRNLTDLNVSGFNTANVTDMLSVFENCRALTGLNVSNWNTANVTTLSNMFRYCIGLTSLDLSNWNTANVTNMSSVFSNCTGLTSLDVSGFNTANVTTMSGMFYSCSQLTGIDVSSFNTEKVTTMQDMFNKCSSLTSLDLSTFNTQSLKYAINMLAKCPSLTSLDLTNLNTANVTSMTAMFDGCSSLTTLDLTSFNTAKVTSIMEMFRNCSSLTTIFVGSEWTTAALTGTSSDAFLGCTSLVGGQGTTYDANHVDDAYAHIDGGTSNPGYFTAEGAEPWHGPEAYACYTPSNTTLTFYYDGQRSSREGMTYDLPVDNSMPAWHDGETNVAITQAVFDASFADARPTTTSYWFNDMTVLTSITGMEHLNTSEVTTMKSMFSACYALTGVDVSNFNTENVTDMYAMFYSCRKLTSLDVSGFNTANVTDMTGMFTGCQRLTSLDVSSFNTANVTTMDFMFASCIGLTTLDLNSFNTSKVAYMQSMFAGCTNLTTIYVGDGWNTARVYSSDNMFQNCTSLVGDKGTTFDANHTNKAYAHIDGGPSDPGYLSAHNEAYACYTPSNTTLTFYYDNQRGNRTGTTYDLNDNSSEPGWYTDGTNSNVTAVVFDPAFAYARPTTTSNWFYFMTNLQSITGINYLNTSEVTSMGMMFGYCTSLTSLDVSGFNTANVTEMGGMFFFCGGLTSLDVSNFNTANVSLMNNMFFMCSGLTSLDLSSFNTANVYNTSGMFAGCENLTTIYVGNEWSTAILSMSSNMFLNCSSLVGGMGTTYDENHVDAAYAHTDGGPSNPGYLSEKPAFLLGDVNGDGNVTVADVTALISLVLGGNASAADHPAADMNGDGNLTVADVTALISRVLGGA